MVLFAMVGDGAYNCSEFRCGSDGPSIHFPFRLRHQPEYCGYPGFELSCDRENRTILILPNSLTLIVREIDYMSQQISLSDSERCLILNILHLNLSALSPSLLTSLILHHMTFQFSNVLATCKKIHEIPSFLYDTIFSSIRFSWLNPICKYCEGLEKDCGFKNYTKQLTTQCFDRPFTTKGGGKKPLIAGGVIGLVLLGIIMMAFYECYSSSKIERENQARVEKFLEDYRARRPTRYTYADIKKITNQFQEILGEGAYGIVYKGTLTNEIHVAIKVLNDSEGNGEEFINEVAAMGKIHHVNVVRLVGFCADGVRRA